MASYKALFKSIEEYVTNLFEEHPDERLVYHNLSHTQYVVDKTTEIAGHYPLSEKDMVVVFAAAWFHDTGYLFTDPRHHEEKSAELMRTFLQTQQAEESIIDEVAGCIMATKHGTSPVGLLQEMVCDADSYNFGTKDFLITNKKVFREMEINRNGDISVEEFNRGTDAMLKSHKYYTSYCRDLLNKKKKKNLKNWDKNIQEEEDKENDTDITEKGGVAKGMQTLLRLTSSNHMELSQMADKKADILISVNAIIISVILSVLFRKLQTNPYLTIPSVLFLVVAVTTIVISIIATRPKVNKGIFREEDVVNKKINLLFFGNFHHVSLETYDKAMREMMRDSDYLYNSIIQDIYYLGAVLGKKYKLIRLAYNIFMIGIIASVLAFALATFFFHTSHGGASSLNQHVSPF